MNTFSRFYQKIKVRYQIWRMTRCIKKAIASGIYDAAINDEITRNSVIRNIVEGLGSIQKEALSWAVTNAAVDAVERGEIYISPTGRWDVKDTTTPEDIDENMMRFDIHFTPDIAVSRIPVNLTGISSEELSEGVQKAVDEEYWNLLVNDKKENANGGI